MSKIEDGGQAFPRASGVEGGSHCDGELGMSLRDWFAGQALTGLIAFAPDINAADQAHVFAYRFADAMLAARAQPPKPVRDCKLCHRPMDREPGDVHSACVEAEALGGES